MELFICFSFIKNYVETIILNSVRFSEQNTGFALTSFQPLLWSASGLMATQGAAIYIVAMGFAVHSFVEWVP